MKVREIICLLMFNSLESIDIRVGKEEDGPGIASFASMITEDPLTSKNRWEEIIKDKSIYPLLAEFKGKIVGKIQARVVNGIGWLEEARVAPSFRKKGIANTLVDTAMDWLISQGVSYIRTVMDSDNLSARRIMEKHNFSDVFLAINPTCRVLDSDASPEHTSKFTKVLDIEFFDEFKEYIDRYFLGNIMIDGRYLKGSKELYTHLIENQRVYTNIDRSIMVLVSDHNLPHEFHGFVISKNPEGYKEAGLALRGYAAREIATIAVCHAPARRHAVLNLGSADFGWSQPHSIIIYQRDAWQGRN